MGTPQRNCPHLMGVIRIYACVIAFVCITFFDVPSFSLLDIDIERIAVNKSSQLLTSGPHGAPRYSQRGVPILLCRATNSTSSNKREIGDGGKEDLVLKDQESFSLMREALEYKYGENGKEKNYKKAAELFLKVTKFPGSLPIQACHELGDIYMFGGPGVHRDLALSVKFFQDSANGGFAPSLHMMSFVYSTGLLGTVQRDEAMATRLEYLAAMTNHVPAIMGMGFRFLYGQGVKRSCELALKHYKFAAEVALRSDENMSSAPLQDGDRLGPQTVQNWQNLQTMQSQKHDIINYWEYKAKGGDPMAKCELAKLHEEDAKCDPAVAANEAESLYREAAREDVPVAMRELGVMLLQGRPGLPPNITRSVEYFKSGAALGDAECQNSLGNLFFFGLHQHNPDAVLLSPNRTLAMEYFREAAAQDFPESLFFLGETRINAHLSAVEDRQSEISEADYFTALRHYERAADYGYMQAYWREAQLYEAGKGIPRSCSAAVQAYKVVAEAGPWVEEVRKGLSLFLAKDYEGALIRYSIAGQEGYEIAQSNAGWLHMTGNGCVGGDCNVGATTSFYHAFLQGCPEALYYLGLHKQKGSAGVQKDPDGARYYFEQSLLMGDTRSLVPLASEYERTKKWYHARNCYRYSLNMVCSERERLPAGAIPVSRSALEPLYHLLKKIQLTSRISLVSFRKYVHNWRRTR
eukprot:GHVQ01024308.1.p1 GENE.GHVQ01024308.1~~GHVQ01024308.1.p1  ORF type:complete len:693 (-),score=53.14 GHVQ01024308.1:1860-3938(-)